MKRTRREFLAAATAAPILSPIILGVQDKAGTRRPVLGAGAYTYEAIHDWGELPARIKWGNTHGVVEDAEGNIYVHHTVHASSDSADSMVVFDRNGKFIRSWGKEFRGVAHGLHIRKEGRDEFLYLTVNASNPQMTPQPAMQAVVVKATTKMLPAWSKHAPCGQMNCPGMNASRGCDRSGLFHTGAFESPRCSMTWSSLSINVTRPWRSGTTTIPFCSSK